MNSTNIFMGMNSDVARIYQTEKEYLSCKNMRPVTTLGGSNGSLVNIKGNQCQLSFPVIRAVYKLAIELTEEDDVVNEGTVQISVTTGNVNTTGTITINESTTTADIQAYIAELSNHYNGVSTTKRFSSAYNSEFIYIYQMPYYETCEPQDSYNLTITINQLSGLSTIKFVDSNGALDTTQREYIPAQIETPVIIGSTFINETIYLYTCGFSNVNGLGQIWEVEYDQPTSTTSVKLLYNNYIDFSVNSPIPPTATIGRYEVPTVQRIYWSDNSNPVRSCNVKDPNLFATEPEILNLRPSVEMNIPTLYGINDGAATTGLATWATYQCSYRLVKFNGAVTNYSPLSSIVYLTPQAIGNFTDAGGFFASLQGDSSVAINKSITWRVSGIDTNYDTIEFVVAIRTYPSAEDFNVYRFDSKPISGNETLTASFTNTTTTMEEISLTEFLIDNTTFTHCKTLEQKDNRLFYGNVRSTLGDYLETFDTRTYRFAQGLNYARVKASETDTAETTLTITSSTSYTNIDETDDNIPVYNLDIDGNTDGLFRSSDKFQINSSIVGGTGPNISYKFGSLLLRSDKIPSSPAHAPGSTDDGTARDTGSSTYSHGFRVPGATSDTAVNPTYNNGAPDQEHYTQGYKETMALEYFGGQFKTGMHNEIYRYGIVFHGKQGSRYFVKWIGDIKFPNYSDSVAPGLEGHSDDGAVCSDHRSMFIGGDGSAYVNLPYIQFEINIPVALAALISGYEIVRVQRTDNDRTVTSQGLINQVMNVGSGVTHLPMSNTIMDANAPENMDPFTDPLESFGSANDAALTFHPFKELVDNSSGIANGDKIVIVEKYISTIAGVAGGINPSSVIIGASENLYYIAKFYNLAEFIFTNGYDAVFNVHESQYLGIGQESNPLAATGNTYKNWDTESLVSETAATGSPTVIIGLDNNITWEDYNSSGNNVCSDSGTSSNAKLLAINYKPSKLRTQYGGRTYTARNASEYISTGAFYKVTESGTTTIDVFGGDIYHGVLNVQKAIKNWDPSTTGGGLSSFASKHSQTWYFPTQSVYNVDLRNGVHVNRDLNSDDGNGASGADDYAYDSYYSYENNLNRYIPKPLLFNETGSFFNRICWSNVKINAETADSWTVTPTDNYYDLDGNYGPINSLITLRDNMYAIQDRAIAYLIVNPQALHQDADGFEMTMGEGETLNKHKYLALDVGSKHQWSISKSSSHITFIDANKRKIFLFDGQALNPISDTKGQRGFINKILHGDILTTDNPIIGTGLLTTYDYVNNEFLYTTLGEGISGGETIDEKYTLVFSDITDAFSAFYNFTPYIYINNHNILYTPSLGVTNNTTKAKLWLHNVGNYGEFYDTTYPCSVKAVINKSPLNTKVFDNLSWLTESIKDNEEYWDDINNFDTGRSDNVNYLDDTIKRIRCYNEYQNTDWVTMDQTAITGNLRKTEQGFNTFVPRNKVNYDTFPINTHSIFSTLVLTKTEFGERMRDKYMVVDLEYDNQTGNRFILHNLSSTFRASDR